VAKYVVSTEKTFMRIKTLLFITGQVTVAAWTTTYEKKTGLES
jgi:hypothetical protein